VDRRAAGLLDLAMPRPFLVDRPSGDLFRFILARPTLEQALLGELELAYSLVAPRALWQTSQPPMFPFLTTRGQSIRLSAALHAMPYDQVRTLYRTLLVFATVGVVILAVGLVEFVYFEPPGQASGAKARIVGVYAFDPATDATSGSDQSQFARTQQFAAVVDWSSLPSNLTVDARWYDAFGDVVGRVGPSTPDQLTDKRIVPVIVPPGFHHSLPGHYTFVVERIQGGVPIEVLARRIVLVQRT
jgi:hypothetical protein